MALPLSELGNIVEQCVKDVQLRRASHVLIDSSVAPEVKKGKSVHPAELEVYKYVREQLNKRLNSEPFVLAAENFEVFGNPDAKLRFYLDPIDGTVYFARAGVMAVPDVSIVLSQADGKTYDDVVNAVVGDVFSRHVVSAARNLRRKPYVRERASISAERDVSMHDPVLLSDFYFKLNTVASLLVPSIKDSSREDRREFLNPGSVVMQAVLVADSQADAFINLVGPKGDFELTAMYRILKEAGGHSMHFISGKELGSAVITDKRVPVIMARNEGIARQLYDGLEGLKPFVEKNDVAGAVRYAAEMLAR